MTTYHYHKCPKCEHIWSHTREEAMMAPKSHTCKKCGEKNVVKKYNRFIATKEEKDLADKEYQDARKQRIPEEKYEPLIQLFMEALSDTEPVSSRRH